MDETSFHLVVKRLSASDLGWFEAVRTRQTGRPPSNQRGVNLDTPVVESIFPSHALLEGEIRFLETFQSDLGSAPLVQLGRPLRHQGKNWRITGDKVPGQRFTRLEVGDFLLMAVFRHLNRWMLIWDGVAASESDAFRKELWILLEGLIGAPPTGQLKADGIHQTLHLWRKAAPKLFAVLEDHIPKEYGSKDPPIVQTQKRVSPHLLDLYMRHVAVHSPLVQQGFFETLNRLSTVFRSMAQDQIRQIPLDHRQTWTGHAGQRIGFVDGGTAAIQSLGSAPLAIRVGCYTVVPGDTSDQRETFEMTPQLVDDLFAPDHGQAAFLEEPEPNALAKVHDMARIVLETGGLLQTANKYAEDLSFLFIHGPLVNPVSPYGRDKLSPFSPRMLEILGLNLEELHEHFHGAYDGRDLHHFIPVYKYLLDRVHTSGIPTAGVIERASESKLVTGTFLQHRLGAHGKVIADFEQKMKEFGISDALLFAATLRPGEHLVPIQVDKNDIKRAPEQWKRLIEKYPKPWSTYLSVDDTSLPFRIELTDAATASEGKEILRLTYHMARLLPGYGFPVGLDIVDKYAKVPAWMSRELSRHQASNILQRALITGNSQLVNQVRLLLTGNTRDWFRRPKHDTY